MKDVGVDEKIIFKALDQMKTERILPFRFIAAVRYAPQWESQIEKVMLKSLEGKEKLPGKTVLLVDVSRSMNSVISGKSDLSRIDAANGLAILTRELCQDVAIYSFSNNVVRVPDRHGFALRDAINTSQSHSSTLLGQAIMKINESETYDRIIILTDEQAHDVIPNPTNKGYIINVAAYQNGIGYGPYTHISGWSEAVLDYIQASEEQ